LELENGFGEGAYWSEFVDSTGIVPQTFPRLSSIAERLWSRIENTGDIDEAWAGVPCCQSRP